MTALSPIIPQEQMQNIISEFRRLKERCYLENAGAMLYPDCLVQKVNEDLLNNVYMNPHTDAYTRDCIEQIRCLILDHFNTDSSKYTVIFTSGTTQSLKLVVESFQFSCTACEDVKLGCGSFMYLRDSHTSVLGLRGIAKSKNADIIHISHEDFLKYAAPTTSRVSSSEIKIEKDGNSLLVYPAQSNFNGYKYPLQIIEDIKKGCYNNYVRKNLCKVNCHWYVLLDAASYVPTNRLDLSETQPDFVCMSFYKIFGYPTGLGALLVKNSSSHVLNQKTYFGGGTVDVVLSSEDFHVKRNSLHERFEDGTVPFLAIISLKHCFDTMHKLIPDTIARDFMKTISHHTFNLAKDLYQQLIQLKHSNGSHAAVLYTDTDFSDIKKQGGIVTFNLVRDDGSYIGYAEFQHMADLFNINIRTGCFCNSGSCQRHLRATNNEIKEMYKAGHKCGDEFDLIDGKPTGAVRASFAYYNTFMDVDKLMMMICRCFVKCRFIKPAHHINKIIQALPKNAAPICRNEVIRRRISLGNENIGPYKATKSILKEMAIFPIKSCGAFKIKSTWKIGPKGFEYDREWMVVKDNGVCLTQKTNTRMCMIRPTINLPLKVLTLNFKGKSPISIPLEMATLNNNNKIASLCKSKVCTDIVSGEDCGDDVADWISEALEMSYLRLFRQSKDDTRLQKKKVNQDRNFLSLSNQAQFLLINKATVRWLKKKIQDPMFTDNVDQLTDRFRGNLIIDMDDELVERNWQHNILIGEHEFKVEGQCPRCQMVCIDQQTGEKTIEPLRTISEEFGGKLRFGIYLTYIGTVNGSNSSMLKIQSSIKLLNNGN